ncbi:MAG: mismatch-specific DNA-glycosylase [Gemmatimonadota bacterium]
MLPDLLIPGLRLVICGSAASTASARAGAYYAGPQNRFWRTLHEVGLTPRLLAPAEYRELLPYGIGLTDIVKSQVGSDRDIHPSAGDAPALRKRIARVAPAMLCFNGKRPAQQLLGRATVDYGLQTERLDSVRLFVAPSTSAAARGHWSIDPWHELARLVRELPSIDGRPAPLASDVRKSTATSDAPRIVIP